MKNLSLLTLLIVSVSLANAQTTVEIFASKDNTIYSESGTTSNGAGSYLFAGATNGGFKRRGLVFFDLSTIPSNAQITSVKLLLFCSKAASGQGILSVSKVTTNWGEGNSDANAEEGSGAPSQAGDATWTHPFFGNATMWGVAGGDYHAQPSATIGPVSSGSLLEISSDQLKMDVIGWVQNTSPNFGWILIGREGESASSRRYNSRHNSTNPPRLSVTYEGTLPVQLLSFTANRTRQVVQLNWKTARDENFSHFDVEYSPKGVHFQRIEIISRREDQQYRYNHINHSTGIGYYRLAMLDRDGSSKYSKVVKVETMQGNGVTLWPNPAGSTINIRDIDQGRLPVYRILDLEGRVIQSERLLTPQVNISTLKMGKYIFEVWYNDGSKNMGTFLKQGK